MSLANLLSAEQIIPEMKATERWSAIVELIDLLVSLGKIKPADRDPILAALKQREETMSTGIGFGIAIPHCSSDRLDEVVAAFGRSTKGIEFDALDNAPVKFVVLFIVPKNQFQTHLRTLASIAKFLNDRSVRESLAEAKSADAIIAAGLPHAAELTPATDPRFGDYQTNAALVLGKERSENPKILAAKILAQLDVGDLCDPPTVAGAGFINFTLRADAIARKALEVLRNERLGVPKAKSTKRIVIDFGSPNVAKPMHAGHIRSTVLGDALARIAQFLGHEVIRDNHVGDWGTQFGMVIYGWKNLLDRQALQRDPLAEIVRIYKETNERTATDPDVREACLQELIKLQAGDRENLDIWNEWFAF